MKLELADVCDLFPYVSLVPINCKARLDIDEVTAGVDAFRVAHIDEDGASEEAYSIPRGSMNEFIIRIPYRPFKEQSRLTVESLVKGKTCRKVEVDILGHDEGAIPIGSERTSDSMYVRTLPGSPIVSVSDFFKEIATSIPYRESKGQLQLSEAESYMRLFYRYFGQFEIVKQEFEQSYARVSNVIDSMYEKNCNPYTAGIIFLSLTSRLGLDGISCISGGRCFIGLALDMVSNDINHQFCWITPTITTTIDYPYPEVSVDRYLMMEVASNLPFEESVQSAYDYCTSTIAWDGVCRCSIIERKISQIERNLGNITRIDGDGGC